MIRRASRGLLGLALAVAAAGAEFPAVVGAALDAMPVDLPAELAYTMDIDRNGRRSTERYDPSRPAGARWTLMALQGREPSAAELAEYQRHSAGRSDPGYRASFRPAQVDRTHAEIVMESPTHVTVRAHFTEAAAESDGTLGRLDLTLLVRKDRPSIVSYRLELRASYAPVLGVKMHALDAGAELDEAGRPRRTWSRFHGRIFLRSTDEIIEVRYRDYAPAAAEPRPD
ncbi:MAG TPA: hypothetical protein VEB66_13430 [Opitutaceae bacterium]|nr:hypothetical protein [Opitutaceae bacterium]